jgi:hypothetical protein
MNDAAVRLAAPVHPVARTSVLSGCILGRSHDLTVLRMNRGRSGWRHRGCPAQRSKLLAGNGPGLWPSFFPWRGSLRRVFKALRRKEQQQQLRATSF